MLLLKNNVPFEGQYYSSGISGMSLSNFPSDTHEFQTYFEPFFYVTKPITILAIISVFSLDLVG